MTRLMCACCQRNVDEYVILQGFVFCQECIDREISEASTFYSDDVYQGQISKAIDARVKGDGILESRNLYI